MASGNLIQPRVRVLWGKTNLTAYDGPVASFPQGTPVIFDVEVHLSAESEGPTAQMSWDPTGPGMQVYESFISSEEYMATQIMIEFFYPQGKKIRFPFMWTGQTINYGNDMSIIVKMQSELAGLINANIRSTAQANDKGTTAIAMIDRAKKQFGLEKYDIVRYTEKAKTDLQKAKLLTSYGNDWTFGANLNNIATQTGNVAFANNIKEANIVIYTPFSWDKEGAVQDGANDITAGSLPDPTIRYGYILGPAIINSVSRSTDWRTPQQTNDNKPGTQTRARDPVTGRFKAQTPPTAPQVQQSNQKSTAAKTSAPLGTANGRSTPGIGNKDNPDQVPKQNALQDEKVAQLSMQAFLCPLLVGIKPHDILYIPSFKGDYIEDWIVQSVDYDQQDGKVEVSIQATRVYGLGTPMNTKAAEKFKKIATTNNLTGPTATLEAWTQYAWAPFSS